MRILVASLVVLSFLSFTYKDKKFKSPENFVFIPSGNSEFQGKTYSCQAFWMLEHEVTNFEYYSFLKQLLLDGKKDDYLKALPDTAAWDSIGGSMSLMKDTYFYHPAYAEYPVVNVSNEGADMFCVYLTEYYRSIYGDVINDFRLPTKLEWIYAAKGGLSRAPYPWGGPGLRDEDGRYLANFNPIGDQNIKQTKDGYVIVQDSLRTGSSYVDGGFLTTAPKSYAPNAYGLHDMAGNVAEMVAKEDVAMGGHWYSAGYDVRVSSQIEFERANPFVGFRPVMSFLTQE